MNFFAHYRVRLLHYTLVLVLVLGIVLLVSLISNIIRYWILDGLCGIVQTLYREPRHHSDTAMHD